MPTWNVNGLAKYSQEIKTFIFSQNINFYLFLKYILLTKATFIFLDCITQCILICGEIAFIIRNSIRHDEIGKYQREFLQIISIVIENWNDCITISAIYSDI